MYVLILFPHFWEEFNFFCLSFVLVLISASKLHNFTFTFIFLSTHLTMLAIGLNVLMAYIYCEKRDVPKELWGTEVFLQNLFPFSHLLQLFLPQLQ